MCAPVGAIPISVISLSNLHLNMALCGRTSYDNYYSIISASADVRIVARRFLRLSNHPKVVQLVPVW